MKNMKDAELLVLIKSKVQAERNLTLEIIDILQEIQSRRLHLQRGYSSLHEFCVKELKYSDGAAYRRIKAMKLVEEMPEAIKSIESGSLTLTTASQLQNVFESKAKTARPLTQNEKAKLFRQIQNQSRQEVERTIAKVCPEIIKRDEKVRMLNNMQVKVELILDEKLYAKLERLKNLTSHRNKNFVELIEHLADQELKRIDPEEKAKIKTSSSKKSSNAAAHKNSGNGSFKTASPTKLDLTHVKTKNSRYIPSAIRHAAWMNSKGRCTFIDPLTKRRCDSNHRLQLEHIKPYAIGGENSVDNLRILCANHNELTAIRFYGKNKIESYQHQGSGCF
ncbi:MAG: HNH endonuclease [Bdellovibrionales bacterium]